MNGDFVLLDTNTVLYLLKGDEEILSLVNSKYIVVSVITEIELLSNNDIPSKELSDIHDFLSNSLIINIEKPVKSHAIEFRKNYKFKLPDAIILATAKFLNITLITADKKFSKISEANIIYYQY